MCSRLSPWVDPDLTLALPAFGQTHDPPLGSGPPGEVEKAEFIVSPTFQDMSLAWTSGFSSSSYLAGITFKLIFGKPSFFYF